MTITAPQDEGVDLRGLGAIPFGIVTTALTIAIAVLSVAKFDFNPIGFSIFLIVPIGAFIAGCLAASGLAGGLQLMQSRPTVISYLATMLLGLACFLGIYYGIYDRTYVDDNHEINYHGEGDHISTFVDTQTGEPFTFWRYLQLDVRSRDLSFYNSSNRVNSIDMSGTVGGWINWGLFGLEGLGILAGCIVVVERIDQLEYCASCRRYMRSGGSVQIAPDALSTVWARLRTASPDQESLNAATTDVERATESQPHVRIRATRCDGCNAGSFIARSFLKKSDKGKYSEVTSARLSIGVASPMSGFVPTPATGLVTDRQPSIYDHNYDPRQPAL